MKLALLLYPTLLLALPCAAQSPQETNTTKAPQWAAPELGRAVVVRDGRTGVALSFEALLDALA